MNRFIRIAKHRWLDEEDAHRALGTDGLARIGARVTASEQLHTGEIRVCVEASLPLSYLWRGAAPRERALTMFGKLRVWDTDGNNGVLIYLLLAERAIEIVADRGLARQVSEQQWQAIIDPMRDAFRGGRFEAGLDQAVGAVHALLIRHFPSPAGSAAHAADRNELPDTPDVR